MRQKVVSGKGQKGDGWRMSYGKINAYGTLTLSDYAFSKLLLTVFRNRAYSDKVRLCHPKGTIYSYEALRTNKDITSCIRILPGEGENTDIQMHVVVRFGFSISKTLKAIADETVALTEEKLSLVPGKVLFCLEGVYGRSFARRHTIFFFRYGEQDPQTAAAFGQGQEGKPADPAGGRTVSGEKD